MPKEYPSLPQRLLDAVDHRPSQRAQIYRAGGRWESFTSQEMLRRIAGLSSALAEFGVGSGDRVAIFAPNCPEWHVADFAIAGLGAVAVPIYFRESAEHIEFIASHAQPKVIFVAGEEQRARLGQIRSRMSSVEHVVAVGDALVTTGGAANDVLSYEKLIASAGATQVAAYRSRAAALRSDQLASIIYTSGTTGEPKGVMLSHANFVSNETASFEGLPYGPEDIALSFLPLSHVYERVTDYGFLFRGISLTYVPRMEDVVQALLEVRPTLAAAVPRFFEKLYANIMQAGAQATGMRRRLFDWSINVGRRSVPWRAYGRSVSATVKAQWWLADKLVYAKFRAGIGGRVRLFISGGGPLAPELAEFFNTVGIPVSQGYGLTETSPVISFSVKAPDHIGTSGHPIRDVEVHIADDGEILVRGPCVMMGYYQKPEETRAAISPDGWFATGDIGHLDKDGYLTITDRKKEVLKTAGGKMIAPAPIENALKTSPYIQTAALVGDKRRFIAALIVPNFANLAALAREKSLPQGSSPAELCAQRWVRQLVEKEIARLTANLAQYETIKRFALLDREFTFDGGELTYTLKLKRREIERRYADVIEGLYAETAPTHTLLKPPAILSGATNRATREDWRELGFFYNRDDQAKIWKLTGSRDGLLKFRDALLKYVADPRNVQKSEHEHYGPYMYLKIMTWPEAGFDEHAIRGPLPDLRRLASLVEASLARANPGDTFRIQSEFSATSPYALILEVRADGFDPAEADTALPKEIDSSSGQSAIS